MKCSLQVFGIEKFVGYVFADVIGALDPAALGIDLLLDFPFSAGDVLSGYPPPPPLLLFNEIHPPPTCGAFPLPASFVAFPSPVPSRFSSSSLVFCVRPGSIP